MKNIETTDELITTLGLPDINELDSEEVIEIIKNNNISPDLFKEMLNTVPMLTEAFNQMFRTMGDVGISMGETKRLRWETIKELALEDKLKGDQILEAMKYVKEIEEKENIPWGKIFTGLGGALALGFLAYLKTKNKMNDLA